MTAVPTISGYCGGRPRLPQHLRREARDPGTRRRAATRRRFRGRFGAGQSRGRAVATRSATTSAHGRPRRIRAHLKVNYGAWGAPGASWTGTGSVPSPAGLCLNGNLPPSSLAASVPVGGRPRRTLSGSVPAGGISPAGASDEGVGKASAPRRQGAPHGAGRAVQHRSTRRLTSHPSTRRPAPSQPASP